MSVGAFLGRWGLMPLHQLPVVALPGVVHQASGDVVLGRQGLGQRLSHDPLQLPEVGDVQGQ